MSLSKHSFGDKLIVWGSFFIFFVGAPMHFVYEFSGNNLLVGSFAPINESVWEHLKMIPLPLMLWWGISYKVASKKESIHRDKWLTASLVSLLVSIITVPMLFYFYTGAFGIESLLMDILILFVAILLGQVMALHFYTFTKSYNGKASLGLSLLIILLFVAFTFYTPRLPIFKDSVTKTYGIYQIK